MRFLKQSTSVDVGIGPFLDETDGKTAETALTITQADIRLKKNNGNWAQKAAAQTLTHEEAGWYELTLDDTDTNTLGHLLVAIHESGALPVWCEFEVVTANVYDTLFSTDVFDTSVTQWLGQAVAAVTVNGVPEVDVTHVAGSTTNVSIIPTSIASILDDTGTSGVAIANGAITAPKFGAGAIDAAATSADFVDEILDEAIGDGTITFRQALRILVASQAAIVSGGGTTTITIRNVADSQDVIVSTVDADGNRIATTVTP